MMQRAGAGDFVNLQSTLDQAAYAINENDKRKSRERQCADPSHDRAFGSINF